MALLTLNVSGLFLTLRNDDIYTEPRNRFPNDITLTAEQAFQQMERMPGESATAYATRLTFVTNRAIAYYWQDEGIERYNLRVPIWENYILWLGRYLQPSIYEKYEFSDYRKAIERGIGRCSVDACILVGRLRAEGIEAHVVGLDGHVVATAEVSPGKWYILDSSFGLVIPMSLSQIEANPDTVSLHYTEEVYYTLDVPAAKFYEPEGNIIYPDGVAGYLRKKYYAERVSYVAIWIIPIGLMLPFGITAASTRFRDATRRRR